MHERVPPPIASTIALLSCGLVALVAAPAHATSLSSTKCGDINGVDSSAPVDVALDVIVGHATSSVDTTARREHIRISEDLADQLGLSGSDVGDSGPATQVRVTLEDVDAVTGLVHSAAFTVAEIDPMLTGLRLEVWLPSDLDQGAFSDDDNGFYKLFGYVDPDSVLPAEPQATVHLAAPSTTVVVSGGTATDYVHFAEANSGTKYYRECVELHDDDLAVLVPHGGSIETKISDQMPAFLTELETRGQAPSMWETVGRWTSGTFVRWHITSTQLSTDSFPGLATLDAGGPYDYALSLHGYADSGTDGVVFGGRAPLRIKCYLVDAIETYLASSSNDGVIEYKLYGPDGSPIDHNGSLGNKSSLSGQSSNNIVNRISPATLYSGGIQLEMSSGLRNDSTLFPLFMDALAKATDDLVDLNLTAQPIDYCATL